MTPERKILTEIKIRRHAIHHNSGVYNPGERESMLDRLWCLADELEKKIRNRGKA